MAWKLVGKETKNCSKKIATPARNPKKNQRSMVERLRSPAEGNHIIDFVLCCGVLL